MIAVGAKAYEAREVRTAETSARIAELDRELADVSAREAGLIAATRDPALRQDLAILVSERSLTGIDIGRLTPERRETLEAVVAVMSRHDRLYSERHALAGGSEGQVLIGADGKERGKIFSGGTPDRPIYTVSLIDSKQRPIVVQRFDSAYGLVAEIDVAREIEALARGEIASRPGLNLAGRLALPYLEAYASGEISAESGPRVVRARAAILAGGMGSPRAFEPLVALLEESRGGEVDGVSAHSITQTLLNLPPTEVSRFRAALKSASAEVRAVAAQFLSYYASERDEEALKARLIDETPAVRHYAAIGLGRLRAPEAVPRLIEAARGENRAVAERASIALATYGDERCVRFLVESLSDRAPAPSTIAGAVRSNDPSMAPALRDLAFGGSPPSAIWRGLSRWAFRGTKEGREGIIAGSLNPNLEQWVRQYLEAEMVAMDREGRRGLVRAAKRISRTLDRESPDWRSEAFSTFLRCRALGIERPERIPAECMEEILGNRERPTRDARPLVTFVYPRGDSNGAFYGGSQMIADLVKNGYRVMYYEVESDKQLAAALRHAAGLGTAREQKASIIVLGGHGTPTTIHLERDNAALSAHRGFLDTDDGKLLRRKRVGETLADGGLVLVESCHGGSGGASAKNMANFAREIFPQAAPKGIWSVVTSYSESTLVFDETGKVVDIIYDVPDYRALAPSEPRSLAKSFFERAERRA